MTQTVPLPSGLSAQVTLDSGGSGQVQIGPTLPGVTWTVTGCAVTCSTYLTATKVPVFYLYNGTAAPQNLSGGSTSGSNDTGNDPGIVLHPGQVLTGVWENGDPGSVATLAISGTQEIP